MEKSLTQESPGTVSPISQLVPFYFRWRMMCGDSDLHRDKSRLRLKKHWIGFLETLGKTRVEDLTPELIREFQEDLAFRVTSAGTLLAAATRNLILYSVKSFCHWLYLENYLANDYSILIESVKKPQRLPRNILEEKEMFAILEMPDPSSFLGVRDQIILEIFYGTGIRCGELRKLKTSAIDWEGRFLFIEQGKGGKDRVVPLSKGVCDLLDFYLKKIRPKLLVCGDHDYLIPSSQRKGPLSEMQIERLLRRYAKKAGVNKRVYPHLLRHTCATHMMRHGAPIRCVQELLGHSRIDTTQIYAHVTINDLKKAHARYHPRERMKNKNTVENKPCIEG